MSSPSRTNEQDKQRLSFRRRLLVTLGSTLAVFLSLLVVMIWLVAFAGLNHTARHVLRHEVENVAEAVVDASGKLDADGYEWDEPHHRFAGEHVDPFFVQIFDTRGKLIRSSDNIDTFGPSSYPERLLASNTFEDDLLDSLRKLVVEGQHLYFAVQPVFAETGALIGSVQIARREPGVSRWMRRLTIGLGLGLLLVLAVVFGFIWWAAGRVLRPLATITASTRAISADELGRQIPMPEKADRETAQLTETLNTLLARLERSFDEMQRFTASAAHELQTPLTVLRGHVDVALRRSRTPEAYEQTLRLVREKINHMVSTVQGLLTLARLDQERVRSECMDVDLALIVSQEVHQLRPDIQEKGLEINLDLSASPLVEGHENMLREVISNVLNNALKYTDTGTIDVHLQSIGSEAYLIVSDTGIGISSNDLPHVTDQFYRASSSGVQRTDGSGLGLSLVQRIVSLHGGTLDIASTPGEGTTVHIRLPVAATSAQ